MTMNVENTLNFLKTFQGQYTIFQGQPKYFPTLNIMENNSILIANSVPNNLTVPENKSCCHIN